MSYNSHNMQIDILTIFPSMFAGPFQESIIKRAIDQDKVKIKVHDLRQWTEDVHHSVDDKPYGGGPGMVMMVEPIDKALAEINHSIDHSQNRLTILTSAKGKQFDQEVAHKLAGYQNLIFIAGHYEGIDQRVSDHLVDEELSIGNYVLTGGELPVMVMVDAVVRLIPGVVGDPESLKEESHQEPGYLEYPHYTRPEIYKGWSVPEVLLSGHHAQIKKWRQENAKHS